MATSGQLPYRRTRNGGLKVGLPFGLRQRFSTGVVACVLMLVTAAVVLLKTQQSQLQCGSIAPTRPVIASSPQVTCPEYPPPPQDVLFAMEAPGKLHSGHYSGVDFLAPPDNITIARYVGDPVPREWAVTSASLPLNQREGSSSVQDDQSVRLAAYKLFHVRLDFGSPGQGVCYLAVLPYAIHGIRQYIVKSTLEDTVAVYPYGPVRDLYNQQRDELLASMILQWWKAYQGEEQCRKDSTLGGIEHVFHLAILGEVFGFQQIHTPYGWTVRQYVGGTARENGTVDATSAAASEYLQVLCRIGPLLLPEARDKLVEALGKPRSIDEVQAAQSHFPQHMLPKYTAAVESYVGQCRWLMETTTELTSSEAARSVEEYVTAIRRLYTHAGELNLVPLVNQLPYASLRHVDPSHVPPLVASATQQRAARRLRGLVLSEEELGDEVVGTVEQKLKREFEVACEADGECWETGPAAPLQGLGGPGEYNQVQRWQRDGGKGVAVQAAGRHDVRKGAGSGVAAYHISGGGDSASGSSARGRWAEQRTEKFQAELPDQFVAWDRMLALELVEQMHGQVTLQDIANSGAQLLDSSPQHSQQPHNKRAVSVVVEADQQPSKPRHGLSQIRALPRRKLEADEQQPGNMPLIRVPGVEGGAPLHVGNLSEGQKLVYLLPRVVLQRFASLPIAAQHRLLRVFNVGFRVFLGQMRNVLEILHEAVRLGQHVQIPQVLYLGPQKSGSTSMHMCVQMSTLFGGQIACMDGQCDTRGATYRVTVPSGIKEWHVFNAAFPERGQKGRETLWDKFKNESVSAANVANLEGNPVQFDLSPAYLKSVYAAVWAYMLSPNPDELRFIVSLRDPVDRLVSEIGMLMKAWNNNIDLTKQVEKQLPAFHSCAGSALHACSNVLDNVSYDGGGPLFCESKSLPTNEDRNKIWEKIVADPEMLLNIPFVAFQELFMRCRADHMFEGLYALHMRLWFQLFRKEQFTVVPQSLFQDLTLSQYLSFISYSTGFYISDETLNTSEKVEKLQAEEKQDQIKTDAELQYWSKKLAICQKKKLNGYSTGFDREPHQAALDQATEFYALFNPLIDRQFPGFRF